MQSRRMVFFLDNFADFAILFWVWRGCGIGTEEHDGDPENIAFGSHEHISVHSREKR